MKNILNYLMFNKREKVSHHFHSYKNIFEFV